MLFSRFRRVGNPTAPTSDPSTVWLLQGDDDKWVVFQRIGKASKGMNGLFLWTRIKYCV